MQLEIDKITFTGIKIKDRHSKISAIAHAIINDKVFCHLCDNKYLCESIERKFLDCTSIKGLHNIIIEILNASVVE